MLRVFQPGYRTVITRSFVSSAMKRRKASDDRLIQQKKLWKLLNDKDEAERLQLAEMISAISIKETAPSDIQTKINYSYLPKSVNEVKKILKEYLCHQSPKKEFLMMLLNEVKEIFKKESNVLMISEVKNNESLIVVGDLHGDLEDLDTVFRKGGWPSEKNRYIFNGDFVDRGDSGVEVLTILFCLKTIYPSYVYILRGNHEDDVMGKAYGFFDEVFRKYKSKTLYNKFSQVFSFLPLCTLIGKDIFVVHGGLSRNIKTTLEDIKKIPRSTFKHIITQKDKEKQKEIKKNFVCKLK